MKQSKNLLKPLIAVALLAVILLGMFFTYQQLKPETEKGAKKVVVEVTIPDQKSKNFTLHTDAEYLRQALEEKNLVKGTESDYGLFIQEVDGKKADDKKQEWWCITKDGETVNTGADTTPIKDGDHFEITLKTGY